MHNPSTSLLTVSLLTTALAACGGDPPPPATVRARITDDLGNVLRETKAASQASTANLPGSAALGLLGGGTAAAATARALEPLTRMIAPRARGLSVTGDPTASLDPDATIMWLNDNLFTDANYLGDGIYKVPSALVCASDSVAPDGTVTTAIDPDCAHALEQAQARIRVEENGAALRFAIQLDADHDEPLDFGLAHDQLSVSVNLDDASHALIALAPVFGQQSPNVALSGEATASLRILGTAHARASLTFDRAISFKLADGAASLDSPSALRFASAAGQVFAIELDGNAPLAKLDLGLGETTLHLPASSSSKSTDLDLGGATASATFQGNTLTVDHISLGTKAFTMLEDGALAMSIDLNPADGRSLSATVTADPAAGTEVIAVSPRLDLHASIDHAVLEDAAPVYDVTRVQLDGSLRTDAASSQVAVVTGSFAITTNPAQYGFSAAAGQCVTSQDQVDPTTSNSYTQFSVGACN